MNKQRLMAVLMLATPLIPTSLPAVEIEQALKAVNQYLIQNDFIVDDYKLIGAQNFIIPGRYLGPDRWLITYKRRDLIPTRATAPAGTGGELFVLYDSHEQTFEVTYGE